LSNPSTCLFIQLLKLHMQLLLLQLHCIGYNRELFKLFLDIKNSLPYNNQWHH
jgi:hypothetical protein